MESQEHTRSKKFAELLDSRFRIPGTGIRFGIDALIGVFPGVGDWLGALFSTYFMVYATRLGTKKSVLLRMFFNILVDLVVGAIPVLGDIFDVSWKANIKNAELLDRIEKNPDQLQSESTYLLWFLLILLVSFIIAVLILIGWLLSALWTLLLQL